ncbi:MAG: tetratricopeptide repeat protein [Candidatus Dormibacteraeota bacterium]|nr:tetratricopeptide repeat protein [Candidatus Dormibacteraeota bacterium]
MSLNDGLALIRRHDFEGALPLLAAEVRQRPDDAYAAYYLAYAFVGAQDPQPAATLLKRILAAHPDFSEARTLLGLAKLRTSDFAGASTEYDSVLARDPKNAAALLGLGMIYYWRRETAAAEDYLDRALRADPSARDAMVFKADLRFGSGDLNGAVALLENAKRMRRPGLAEVSDPELADRLIRYEAAREPLRRARGGLPPMPGWVLAVVGVTLALTLLAGAGLPGAWSGLTHYQAGKLRLLGNDYAGCASEMEHAVESAPNSPKAWAYEGYCYLLDHDNKAGLSAWYTARSYDPGITLDTRSDQLAMLAKVKVANLPPVVNAK